MVDVVVEVVVVVVVVVVVAVEIVIVVVAVEVVVVVVDVEDEESVTLLVFSKISDAVITEEVELKVETIAVLIDTDFVAVVSKVEPCTCSVDISSASC
jgi:hypothetical protein